MRRLAISIFFALAVNIPVAAFGDPLTTDSPQKKETLATPVDAPVAFPLYDRVSLRAVQTVYDSDAGVQPWTAIGMSYDVSAKLSYPDEGVGWNLRSRLFEADVLVPVTRRRNPNLRITAIQGDYLRHDNASFLRVPGGIKIPAPFDVGVMFSALGVSANTRADWHWTQFSILDVALMADLLRDEAFSHRFGLGIAGNYTIDRRGDDFLNRTAPMTMGRIRYGYDRPSGNFSVRAFVDYGYHLEAFFGAPIEAGSRLKSEVDVEWAVVAVNGIPIRLVGAAEVDWLIGNEIEWTSSLGLQLDFGYHYRKGNAPQAE